MRLWEEFGVANADGTRLVGVGVLALERFATGPKIIVGVIDVLPVDSLAFSIHKHRAGVSLRGEIEVSAGLSEVK